MFMTRNFRKAGVPLVWHPCRLTLPQSCRTKDGRGILDVVERWVQLVADAPS